MKNQKQMRPRNQNFKTFRNEKNENENSEKMEFGNENWKNCRNEKNENEKWKTNENEN